MAQRRSKSDDIFRRLLGVVRSEFKVGDQFLTVRSLASRESVSLQTAVNLIRRLEHAGIVTQTPGRPAVVCKHPGRTPPYTVALVVPQHAGWFRDRFMDGFAAGFGDKAPRDRLICYNVDELRAVPMVEQIAAMQYDGVIAVAHAQPWPLYTLKLLGQNVLCDLSSDSWPEMPVTCVDFAATAREAGALLTRFGHTRAAIVGGHHGGASRDSFGAGLGYAPERIIMEIASPEGSAGLVAMLSEVKPTALYVPDNLTLPLLLSTLRNRGVRIPDDISIVMHDGNEDPYSGFNVPPISSVGPPIQSIGKALALRMCRMLDGSGANEPAKQLLAPVVRVTGSVRQV